MSSPSPNEIIIDTDCGIDDCVALILAMTHSKDCIRAITTVAGNVDIQAANENIGILSSLCNVKPLLYAGCEHPLVPGFAIKRWKCHHSDGFGGFRLRDEYQSYKNSYLEDYSQAVPQTIHAANIMIQLVNENPGSITVIALGPLSNIAVAITLDPLFLTKVNRVICMGGCLHAKGNSNRAGISILNPAEFNFHFDPEAARIVFASSLLHSPKNDPIITLVPWETTVLHGSSWSFFDTLSSSLNHLSVLLKGVFSNAEQSCRHRHDPLKVSSHKKAFILPDVFPMVAYLASDSVTEFHDCNVQIEVQGGLTRGMTCIDWMDDNGACNCRMVTKMSMEIVEEFLTKTFS